MEGICHHMTITMTFFIVGLQRSITFHGPPILLYLLCFVVIAPERRAGDPGSIPGPVENFFS